MSESSEPFTTEDQLRAVTVGDLTPLTGSILIVDYDHDWPRLFEREFDRVRAVLGPGALRIEHVGSTSIPGLAAKPIIDMILVVRDSADERNYVTRSRRPAMFCGFENRPGTNIACSKGRMPR